MKAKTTFTSLSAITSLLLTTSMQAQTAPQISSEGYLPQYAVDYAEQHRSDFLTKNREAASDVTYRFFYDKNDDACLEATLVPKGKYVWKTPTYVCRTWAGGNGSVGLDAITYRQTKKNFDAAEARMEERRHDPAFAAVEKIVLQIATAYDYDYYAAYGKVVKYRDPNVKKAVCDGYTDATIAAFEGHPVVERVEKWAGRNHTWNVVVLKDGRKIYTDATWYDGNRIDEAGYVVHEPRRAPVDLTFDLDEFNSLGFATDTRTGKLLQVHFAFPDAHRVK
ncbi:hypothetical protein AGMMS49982_17130 [Bacteroidia bacterium]|nr:hypothetical protein AGMMS49982_17130 [Bacteroidia bacterium]